MDLFICFLTCLYTTIAALIIGGILALLVGDIIDLSRDYICALFREISFFLYQKKLDRMTTFARLNSRIDFLTKYKRANRDDLNFVCKTVYGSPVITKKTSRHLKKI